MTKMIRNDHKWPDYKWREMSKNIQKVKPENA